MMMKVSNLAFHNNTDAYLDYTPEECLRKMFAHTGADGSLTIPVWTNGNLESDDEKKEEYYAVKMNWQKKDCENVLEAFHTLYEQLKAIASVNKQIDGDAEKAKQLLSGEPLATWERYLRPFAVEIMVGEEIRRLNEKEYYDELSAEEASVLNEYRKAFRAQCAERIGDRYCATTELIFARRLCVLLELEAPEIIIRSEARVLAQAMAIHRYATAFEIMK